MYFHFIPQIPDMQLTRNTLSIRKKQTFNSSKLQLTQQASKEYISFLKPMKDVVASNVGMIFPTSKKTKFTTKRDTSWVHTYIQTQQRERRRGGGVIYVGYYIFITYSETYVVAYSLKH